MAGTRSSTKMSLRHCRKSKNCSKFTPETEDESQMCVICLDKISCRGKLGSCQHWFCFDCIYEWSKNTNTCPICKKKFRCITKTHLNPGKSPILKVRVKDVEQNVSVNDDEFAWQDFESSDVNENFTYENMYDDTFNIPMEIQTQQSASSEETYDDDDDDDDDDSTSGDIVSYVGTSDDTSDDSTFYSTSDDSTSDDTDHDDDAESDADMCSLWKNKNQEKLNDYHMSYFKRNDNKISESEEDFHQTHSSSYDDHDYNCLLNFHQRNSSRKNIILTDTRSNGEPYENKQETMKESKGDKRKESDNRERSLRGTSSTNSRDKKQQRRKTTATFNTINTADKKNYNLRNTSNGVKGKWLSSNSTCTSTFHGVTRNGPSIAFNNQQDTFEIENISDDELHKMDVDEESRLSKKKGKIRSEWKSQHENDTQRGLRCAITRNGSRENREKTTRNRSLSTRKSTQSKENASLFVRNQRMSTRNGKNLTQNGNASTSMSTQNATRSTKNSSRSTRLAVMLKENNVSLTPEKVLSSEEPVVAKKRKHKKIKFPFDSESESTEDSWTPPRKMGNKRSSSHIFKETQNNLDG